MASNDPVKRYRRPSTRVGDTLPGKKQSGDSPGTACLQRALADVRPHTRRLQESFVTLNRARQLELLEEIARLPTPDSIEIKPWPVTNKGLRTEEPVYPWPSETLIRDEIASARREAAKLSGKPMRTQQLLDIVLAAAASPKPSPEPSPGYAQGKDIWSEAERADFAALRKRPLEIQRGHLAALRIHLRSSIQRQIPESAADALCCLLVKTSRARTDHAKWVLHALDKHLNALADRYQQHSVALNERLIEVGVQEIILPGFKNKEHGQAKLDTFLAKDDQYKLKVIQSIHTEFLKRESAGEALGTSLNASIEKVEVLNEALQQCTTEKQASEADAVRQQLIQLLAKHLPDAVQDKLQALLASPDSARRDQEILALLQTPITSTDKLLSSLKTDAELYEALQIVWGGVAVFNTGFFRDLSEMLLFAGDRDGSLLQEVESKLVTRLGPDKLAGYTVVNAARPALESGEAQSAPPARSERPTLSWLEKKKSQALHAEARQTTPQIPARVATGGVKPGEPVPTSTGLPSSLRGSRTRQT